VSNRIEVELGNYVTGKPESYLRTYSRWFGELLDEPIRLLELGIQRGGSLLLWADVFPRGEIVGLDLNPAPVLDSERIRTYQGPQQDPAVLDRIAAEAAPEGFDIVIDDASHLGEFTLASFNHLFDRHLKPGGLYVIEDWGCGYWSDWPDGHAYEGPPALERPYSPSRTAAVVASLRSVARPVSRRLERFPLVHRRLRAALYRVEGASVQRRFASHDYGIVGVLKQIVDMAGARNSSVPIERIEFTRGVVLIVKSRAET
jgi:SAM-dependent methyltransferase